MGFQGFDFYVILWAVSRGGLNLPLAGKNWIPAGLSNTNWFTLQKRPFGYFFARRRTGALVVTFFDEGLPFLHYRHRISA